MSKRIVIEQPDDETGIANARRAGTEALKDAKQFILIVWPENSDDLKSVIWLSGLHINEVVMAMDITMKNIIAAGGAK